MRSNSAGTPSPPPTSPVTTSKAPAARDAWTRLTTDPVSDTSWTDTSAVNGTGYTYRVMAVDNADNESGHSDTASATPADTRPPAVPTGLSANPGDNRVELSWAAVTAADLAGYHIERTLTGSDDWTRLTTDAQIQTTYTDDGVVNDTGYTYRVVAVDNADNESDPSTTTNATPTDTTPPAVPTGLAVRPWNSVVAIGWSPVIESDLAGYDVLMSADPAGPWQVLNAQVVTDTSYFKTQLTNGTGYFFSIVSVDSHGNRSDRATPVSATPAPRAISLDAGNSHSCRVRADHSLACWGAGFVGDGTQAARAVATPVGGTWRSVSTGSNHSCGVRTDATLSCWGHNFYGQIGDGTEFNNRLVPTQVGSATWKVVAAGGNTSCAVRMDGSLWCWGSNDKGQLGDGTTTNRLVPTQVGTATDWRDVSLGGSQACGLRTDGTAWCWGQNGTGQLGDGTTTNRLVPTQVGTDATWTSLSTGDHHTCGTRSDGTAWCWGYNQSGQLGDGSRTDAHRAHPDRHGHRLGQPRRGRVLHLWPPRPWRTLVLGRQLVRPVWERRHLFVHSRPDSHRKRDLDRDRHQQPAVHLCGESRGLYLVLGPSRAERWEPATSPTNSLHVRFRGR